MSSKDTFEAKTYAANSFACGAFRGLGVAPAPSVYSIVRVPGRRTTVTALGSRTTVTAPGDRTGEV